MTRPTVLDRLTTFLKGGKYIRRCVVVSGWSIDGRVYYDSDVDEIYTNTLAYLSGAGTIPLQLSHFPDTTAPLHGRVMFMDRQDDYIATGSTTPRKALHATLWCDPTAEDWLTGGKFPQLSPAIAARFKTADGEEQGRWLQHVALYGSGDTTGFQQLTQYYTRSSGNTREGIVIPVSESQIQRFRAATYTENPEEQEIPMAADIIALASTAEQAAALMSLLAKGLRAMAGDTVDQPAADQSTPPQNIDATDTETFAIPTDPEAREFWYEQFDRRVYSGPLSNEDTRLIQTEPGLREVYERLAEQHRRDRQALRDAGKEDMIPRYWRERERHRPDTGPAAARTERRTQQTEARQHTADEKEAAKEKESADLEQRSENDKVTREDQEKTEMMSALIATRFLSLVSNGKAKADEREDFSAKVADHARTSPGHEAVEAAALEWEKRSGKPPGSTIVKGSATPPNVAGRQTFTTLEALPRELHAALFQSRDLYTQLENSGTEKDRLKRIGARLAAEASDLGRKHGYDIDLKLADDWMTLPQPRVAGQ